MKKISKDPSLARIVSDSFKQIIGKEKNAPTFGTYTDKNGDTRYLISVDKDTQISTFGKSGGKSVVIEAGSYIDITDMRRGGLNGISVVGKDDFAADYKSDVDYGSRVDNPVYLNYMQYLGEQARHADMFKGGSYHVVGIGDYMDQTFDRIIKSGGKSQSTYGLYEDKNGKEHKLMSVDYDILTPYGAFRKGDYIDLTELGEMKSDGTRKDFNSITAVRKNNFASYRLVKNYNDEMSDPIVSTSVKAMQTNVRICNPHKVEVPGEGRDGPLSKASRRILDDLFPERRKDRNAPEKPPLDDVDDFEKLIVEGVKHGVKKDIKEMNDNVTDKTTGLLKNLSGLNISDVEGYNSDGSKQADNGDEQFE